jgi:hypothetical protein
MKKVGVESTCIYHGYDPELFYHMKELVPYCYYSTGVGKVNTDPVLLCKMGCYHCTKNNKNNNLENKNLDNKNNINKKDDNRNCPNFKEEIVSILRWDKENNLEENFCILE